MREINTCSARRLTFKRTLSLSLLLVESATEPATLLRGFVCFGLAPGSVFLGTCNTFKKKAFFST